MMPERWERVKEIYDSAFHVRPPERRAFLDRACAKDPALRQEVERLLDPRRRWPPSRGSRGIGAQKDPRSQPDRAVERALGNPTSLREAWRTILGSLRHQSPLRIRFVR
jgi:hypothetical protein